MPGKAILPAAIQERLALVLPELEEVAKETNGRRDVERFRRACAGLVFSFWQVRLDHPRSLFDKKRERLIMSRLHENGDDPSELLYAIDGALKDDWTMGRTARSGTRYDQIEQLFRDRAHVERFAEKCRGYRDGRPHALAVKYVGSRP